MRTTVGEVQCRCLGMKIESWNPDGTPRAPLKGARPWFGRPAGSDPTRCTRFYTRPCLPLRDPAVFLPYASRDPAVPAVLFSCPMHRAILPSLPFSCPMYWAILVFLPLPCPALCLAQSLPFSCRALCSEGSLPIIIALPYTLRATAVPAVALPCADLRPDPVFGLN